MFIIFYIETHIYTDTLCSDTHTHTHIHIINGIFIFLDGKIFILTF